MNFIWIKAYSGKLVTPLPLWMAMNITWLSFKSSDFNQTMFSFVLSSYCLTILFFSLNDSTKTESLKLSSRDLSYWLNIVCNGLKLNYLKCLLQHNIRLLHSMLFLALHLMQIYSVGVPQAELLLRVPSWRWIFGHLCGVHSGQKNLFTLP